MSKNSNRQLVVSSKHIEEMRRHVIGCYPEEGCGILGGFKDRVEWVIPVTNTLHSSTRFQMEPQEQVDALYKIEEMGGDLIGIFHSHPSGPPLPSDSDIRLNAIPRAVNIVWFLGEGDWTCHAYQHDSVEGFIPLEIRVHTP